MGMTTGRTLVAGDGNNIGNCMTMLKRYKISFVGGVLLPVWMSAGAKRTRMVKNVYHQHGPKENLMC
ncbi:MAG TPA: hypothetical protein DDY59_15905 [Lachnospiraceae bacterium]|nr:hypothetical protein [Lachnospiraceae bacterium]HCA69692.1 hypothetical protein [Lachnospiraceae bacterium]